MSLVSVSMTQISNFEFRIANFEFYVRYALACRIWVKAYARFKAYSSIPFDKLKHIGHKIRNSAFSQSRNSSLVPQRHQWVDSASLQRVNHTCQLRRNQQ